LQRPMKMLLDEIQSWAEKMSALDVSVFILRFPV
jgi:hypothetical protein